MSKREVTICIESVSDETFTVTGYGWLLLIVTGIFAVSLTTLTFSVGVIAMPLNSSEDNCEAPSSMVLPDEASLPSACNASRLCAETSCLRHVVLPDDDFSVGSARMNELKRSMPLADSVNALRVCCRDERRASESPES